MFATSTKDREGHLVRASRTSITQRLARAAAVHPWRVVVAWGLVLVASMVAIATLIGSAFTADGTATSNPESARASQVIGDSFSQGDRIDDVVVIHAADLTSDDPQFRRFVTAVRSSIEATGATQAVRDPYAADGSGISEDGHAAVVTLVLRHDSATGFVEVIEEIEVADANAAFEVDVTGTG